MKRIVLLLLCLLTMQVVSAKRKEKRSVVRIETSVGVIRVALFDDTPQHRDNFLRLASDGYYDGTLFHRVIRDFMIQGGDPDSRGAAPGKLLGEGGPDYTIPAEIKLPYIHHWRGTLAAARESDDVNPTHASSGSQFYIVWGKSFGPASLKQARARLEEDGVEMTADMYDTYIMKGGTPHLDGGYTVFGEVIEGLKYVKEIQSVETDGNDRPIHDVMVQKMYVEQLSKAAKKNK